LASIVVTVKCAGFTAMSRSEGPHAGVALVPREDQKKIQTLVLVENDFIRFNHIKYHLALS
jgi:hypothetical protein